MNCPLSGLFVFVFFQSLCERNGGLQGSSRTCGFARLHHETADPAHSEQP